MHFHRTSAFPLTAEDNVDTLYGVHLVIYQHRMGLSLRQDVRLFFFIPVRFFIHLKNFPARERKRKIINIYIKEEKEASLKFYPVYGTRMILLLSAAAARIYII